MHIIRKMKQHDGYYEYSASYILKHLKYVIISVVLLLIAIFMIYRLYFIVPDNAYIDKKHTPPMVESSKNVIADDNSVFYQGNFSIPPKTIPIKNNDINNISERLYIYLFQDSHIILFKFNKKNDYRYFSYNAFDLIENQISESSIEEKNYSFLDFYENYTKARFEKNKKSFYMEIPYFLNTTSKINIDFDKKIKSSFFFEFSGYNASMVNWKGNKAVYLATSFGTPSGQLTLPGSGTFLNADNNILAISMIGKTPVRYEHLIIAGITYSPYYKTPIKIFIYDAKPKSDNSMIVKYYHNSNWHIHNSVDTHTYEDFVDYYSRENGFSFVFKKESNKIKNKSRKGLSTYSSTLEEGNISGYITVEGTKLYINGSAIRENYHSVF